MDWIGSWRAQETQFFPEYNQNVSAIVTVNFGSDKSFSSSLQVRLENPDTMFIASVENGSWNYSGNRKLDIFSTQCSEPDDNGKMIIILCEEPRDTVDVNINGNVWSIADDDGEVFNFVRQ